MQNLGIGVLLDKTDLSMQIFIYSPSAIRHYVYCPAVVVEGKHLYFTVNLYAFFTETLLAPNSTSDNVNDKGVRTFSQQKLKEEIVASKIAPPRKNI